MESENKERMEAIVKDFMEKVKRSELEMRDMIDSFYHSMNALNEMFQNKKSKEE